MKDGRKVFRDKDEVGAAEADVRDEDGGVDDVTTDVADGEERDVAVRHLRRDHVMAAVGFVFVCVVTLDKQLMLSLKANFRGIVKKF